MFKHTLQAHPAECKTHQSTDWLHLADDNPIYESNVDF
jgi:hypothetical protein